MSYEYYRYCANPPINFFPRALKDLFKEEKTTVNGVDSIYNQDNEIDYSKTLFDKSDLIFMTPYQLSILRNGFYACHGYDFKNKEFKEIYKNPFTGKYQDNPNFSESDFNEMERKNIEIIREIENLNNPILLSDFLETKLN